MIREAAGYTGNQDFKLRNRGKQRFISLEQADGYMYPLGRPQYFLVCQNTHGAPKLWPYFAFDFDMKRIPSPYMLLRLIKPYNYSSIVN